MTKNIDSTFFLPKPSLGVHTEHSLLIRLRIKLENYSTKRTEFVNSK